MGNSSKRTHHADCSGHPQMPMGPRLFTRRRLPRTDVPSRLEDESDLAGGRQVGLFTRKPIAHVQSEFASGELYRTLGAFNLVTLGIGCIIGAGIFVLTGHAAATMAGPSV